MSTPRLESQAVKDLIEIMDMKFEMPRLPEGTTRRPSSPYDTVMTVFRNMSDEK